MKIVPDFKTSQERDDYFAQHADYFTIIKWRSMGQSERTECKSLEEAEKLAATKVRLLGGRYMVYAVIGEQSALAKLVK